LKREMLDEMRDW